MSVAEPWEKLSYSLSEYPFLQLVQKSLSVSSLTALSSNGPRWTRQTDQCSEWHRRFYSHFTEWRACYDQFINRRIAPWIGKPVYYQAVPTFRVHHPNNVAVGEFHTDAQYYHPSGEITFWLPLTPAYGTNSVWVEGDDLNFHPFVARPGEVVVFYAVSRQHGNLINITGKTRVSFDFRCLPVDLLPDGSSARSVHAGLRFIPGEYYHSEPAGILL
ncbi:phytanoyl-CoA dioxygenase family protein [Rhodococcus rhodochrous]|uniref:streptomycin biosynthesis protein StrG n=1 Tax=Rhodococcus rhodochrous TaxID=1829 RepID=UPI0011AA984F|nr:streptomycin biosynthesis protein StrG [Rhodococcus rhodochrous]